MDAITITTKNAAIRANHSADLPRTPYSDPAPDDLGPGYTPTRPDRGLLRPTPIAIVISSLAVLHYFYLVTRAPNVLICFIPDDAFYELEIARHFFETGVWSFDRGLTRTTGFHLLNVYVMSLFPGILAYPQLAIDLWMGVGVLLSIATIFIICHLANRTFGLLALLPVSLILTARFFTLANTSLLEFPFVVLAAALYTYVLLRKSDPAPSETLILFVIGLFGSLARSDFGGLALAFASASLLRWRWKGRRVYLKQSLWGLAGATAGLVIVFLHNFFYGGHFLSGSAMVKALWGHRLGYSLRPGFSILVFATVSSAPELLLLVSMVGLGIVVWAIGRALGAGAKAPNRCVVPERPSNDNVFLASVGLTTLSVYVFIYGFDPAAQPWYAANAVIPAVLILGSITRWISSNPPLLVSAVAAFLAAIVPHLSESYRPAWYQQRHMYDMALYLRTHPVNGRIAGWNVGIVGYFLDGQVLNLDGLMNDDIFPYVRDSTVNRYLGRMQIDYIVDFKNQIKDRRLAAVEGYDAIRLAEQLEPLHAEVSLKRDVEWVDYTLYRLTRTP